MIYNKNNVVCLFLFKNKLKFDIKKMHALCCVVLIKIE